MQLCVYSTKAAAQAVSDAVDAELGYPKPATGFVGGGERLPVAQTTTYHQSAVIAHPKQPLFGYVADFVPSKTLAKVGAVDASAADASWLPEPGAKVSAASAADIGAA